MRVLFLMLSLVFSMSLYATVEQREQNYSSEEIAPISIEELLELKQDEKARCYAWTICPNGRRISCWSYGASCTWQYYPRSWVRCTGYNNWGRWVSYTYRCW